MLLAPDASDGRYSSRGGLPRLERLPDSVAGSRGALGALGDTGRSARDIEESS